MGVIVDPISTAGCDLTTVYSSREKKKVKPHWKFDLKIKRGAQK